MAFNISNFNAFQETAGEFVSDMDRELSTLATRIVDDMRQRAPVASGDLRNSIKVNLDRYQIIFSMLAYGPYQNYGVEGNTLGGPQKNVLEDPAIGRKHKFGTQFKMTGGDLSYGARTNIHRYGLNRQPFYSIEDIQDQMVDIIENIFNN
jgi:hypothetical protein